MSEQIYDEEIAPVLMELAKKCKDAGIPFLAVAEYEPGSFGTTADIPTGSSYPISWAYAAARSNGNVDALINHLVVKAREVGHNSAYLYQLGVPTIPVIDERTPEEIARSEALQAAADAEAAAQQAEADARDED